MTPISRVGCAGTLLLVVLLALLLLWSRGCQPLILEYDYLQGFEPAIEYEQGPSLAEIYGQAKIWVWSYRDPIRVEAAEETIREKEEREAPLSQLYGDPRQFCSRINQLMPDEEFLQGCMARSSIDSLLERTADRRPEAGSWWWYAHGLAVPCCHPADSFCEENGFSGLLLLPEEIGVPRYRENFLVFYCANLDPDPLTELAVHELAHVLNLDHCEYNKDYVASNKEFGEFSIRHLRDHRWNFEYHVRPGPEGSEWCVRQDPDHDPDMHDEMQDCKDEGDPCDWGSRRPTSKLMQNSKLSVEPEKERYFPGEPIRVRVRLSMDAGLTASGKNRLQSPLALEPELGYLKLWLRQPPNPDVPLPMPVLAEARQPKREDRFYPRAAVADVWFLLPPAHGGTFDPQKPFSVVASFTGFEDRSLVISSDPSDSPPILFEQDPGPPLYNERTHRLFTAAESRRFLYFLGGDHLVQGKENLTEISLNDPNSIYAPYANLALGVSLSLPFHDYDPDRKAITLRPPRYPEALEYLDNAGERVELLPLSYQLTLYQARSRVRRMLGKRAAEADPTVALAHYERAKDDLHAVQRLANTAPPLSFTEQRATRRAESGLRQISEIQERIRSGRSVP